MLTEFQIQFLNSVCVPNTWTEDNDVVNVNGDVNMSKIQLTKIPVQFGRVDGNFKCANIQLTTLEGGPYKVEGYFDCDSNKLTSLKHGPEIIGGFYSCSNNKLVNLISAPKITEYEFYCSNNQLTSLEGCPRQIKHELFCKPNQHLNILYGIGRVEDNVWYDVRNDLNEWIIKQARENIFLTYKDIVQWIKDNNRLEFLLSAQQEIREHFSPRILYLVDMGIYHHNESKILC